MFESIDKLRTPFWVKRPIPHGEKVRRIRSVVRHWGLHTVCESAACPNRQDCYSQGRLTFMLLGSICTRHCSFCRVETGRPLPPDPAEPERLCQAVKELELKYVVITSVCRDDLPDGGAAQFARAIGVLHHHNLSIGVEVLIPDFQGSQSALEKVVAAQPSALNHNVETIPRLYSEVRPQAKYLRSLEVLKRAKSLDKGLLTKSGLMLGLGEKEDEVIAVMEDLREAECNCITLGQYLRPSLKHHQVVRYITPDEFAQYDLIARKMGFLGVASGPLMRSSFNAIDLLRAK
ncbi:MAG: lipoyl synthase [Dehalococcoidia bacterium]|nr:lipoyl synthase [Dehalococcoidia bacterium]